MSGDTHDALALLKAEHAVTRILAEATSLADGYPAVLEAVGTTLGWKLGSAWELTPRATLACIATWQAPGVDAHGFDERSRELELEVGQGLPGRVWASGDPAWIADTLADRNFPRAFAAAEAGLHTAFCFPVRSEGAVLGVLEFFAHDTRAPDDGVLASMASLGRQIGSFIERRAADQAVRRSEARKAAMLEAALDCVITMDHEGRVVEFNPAAERTFGYSCEEVLGREMAELIIPPALRERHRHGLARYLADGHDAVLDRRIEITGMNSDGTEFPVELTITRIRVPGPPLFTGYIRDITDRKRAEQELRDSRTRILDATDAERRRLERDLHDGAQQRLISVGLNLGVAQSKLRAGDPAGAAELLAESIGSLADATAELRSLARGIHPAILTDRGLAAAVAAAAARAPLDVAVIDSPRGQLPAPIEATAYFVVAEALTNVARYAKAAHAEVRILRENGHLTVEVRDDGIGGADSRNGSGLRGLADRVATLDGSLDVVSPPGAGTTVRAELPCAL